MKIYQIKSQNGKILAEVTIYKDKGCCAKLYYCKNPFLIQLKYNKQALINYVYENLPALLTEKGIKINKREAYYKC